MGVQDQVQHRRLSQPIQGPISGDGLCAITDIDYDETFAPIVNMITVRVLLAIAATKGCQLRQMDVKNAFMQGEDEEQVYMEQPSDFYREGTHRLCAD